MSEIYILQIANNQTYEWFEIDETGEILTRRHLTDLSQCPKINPNAHLIALFPGEKITIVSVKLPKMRPSERAQAIPFALEEQLASDPDSIAVALGDTQSDGFTTAAIFEKNILEIELEKLHAANLFPKVMLPDFLSLALEPETWTIVLQNQIAMVRLGFQNGFSVDANNLFLFLKINLDKNKEKNIRKIICWQQDAVIDVLQLEKLGIPIEMRDESQHNYFDVNNLSVKPALNLLQGKYRPKLQSSALQKNWIICGTVAATLFAFLFLSHVAQWIYFRHQSIVLQTKVLQVYQELFPGAKEVLEPRFRAKSLLKKFDNASKSSEFLRLLGAAGKTASTFPDITMQSIQFSDHQLQITVQAKNLQQLSQWAHALREQGIEAKQHILKNEANNVQAQMTIRESA